MAEVGEEGEEEIVQGVEEAEVDNKIKILLSAIDATNLGIIRVNVQHYQSECPTWEEANYAEFDEYEEVLLMAQEKL
ncbi:hypothetical protein A2U01_0078011, partial [Trifolium medium]|nr:hypothetical protein [Trifolium medium]